MIALKEKSGNTAGNVVKLLAGILPLLVGWVIFVCTIAKRESSETMFVPDGYYFFAISNFIFLILWTFTLIFKTKEFYLGEIPLFCIFILKMILSLFFTQDETSLFIDFRYWILETWTPTIVYIFVCCCGLAYMIFNFVLKNEESEARASAGRKMMLPTFFLILCIFSDILARFNYYCAGFLMSEGTFIGLYFLGISLLYTHLQDKIAA